MKTMQVFCVCCAGAMAWSAFVMADAKNWPAMVTGIALTGIFIFYAWMCSSITRKKP